jgi:hypothetical protein
MVQRFAYENDEDGDGDGDDNEQSTSGGRGQFGACQGSEEQKGGNEKGSATKNQSATIEQGQSKGRKTKKDGQGGTKMMIEQIIIYSRLTLLEVEQQHYSCSGLFFTHIWQALHG